jgi:hypothetical protein
MQSQRTIHNRVLNEFEEAPSNEPEDEDIEFF